MLLFLNIDCLFAATADDTEPPGALALASLAATSQAWPRLRLVIASEHRYRMTLAQLRALFPPALQHRVIATTLIYGGLSGHARLTREAEILDWLAHASAQAVEWLALDDRVDDFARHADRLVACRLFTPAAAADLQTRLLLLATPGQAWAAAALRHAEAAAPTAPDDESLAPEVLAEAMRLSGAAARPAI
jgi:hypothetical protein